MKLDIYMNEGLHRILTVGPNGVAPTEPGWTLVDTQYHPAVAPHVDNNGWEGSHTVWHHIRNALYRRGYTDPSKWQCTHSGDGFPNLPVPPETFPPGVYKFTSTDFLASFESAEMTPPAGSTNAVVGLIVQLAVPGGGRYAYADDAAKIHITFGDVELTRVDLRANNRGQSISYYRGSGLPASGKIKVWIDQPDQCMIGPVMGQVSFVSDSFTFRTTQGSNNIASRTLSAPINGNPAIQFWAAACTPRWCTGAFIPGVPDNMDSFLVEQSAVIKGGTVWKPEVVEWMQDGERLGGKLEYDPETGIFTAIHDKWMGHPTVGFLIKRWVTSEPDLKGHYYMEVIEASPADFTTQELGTDNISLQVAEYKSSGPRGGNARDTGRIRRVYTEDAPSHLHHIEPSDSNTWPNRDALVVFVRGLQLGRHIKFRIKQNGQAMRAAIGKSKVPMGAGKSVSISIADWHVLEDDGKSTGLMMVGGTTLPDNDVPMK